MVHYSWWSFVSVCEPLWLRNRTKKMSFLWPRHQNFKLLFTKWFDKNNILGLGINCIFVLIYTSAQGYVILRFLRASIFENFETNFISNWCTCLSIDEDLAIEISEIPIRDNNSPSVIWDQNTGEKRAINLPQSSPCWKHAWFYVCEIMY